MSSLIDRILRKRPSLLAELNDGSDEGAELVRAIRDELAAAPAGPQQPQQAAVDMRALCEAALKADFEVPPLPPGIFVHERLGDLNDRLQMQQYGLRLAQALLSSAIAAMPRQPSALQSFGPLPEEDLPASPTAEWLGYDPERGDVHGLSFEQLNEYARAVEARSLARFTGHRPTASAEQAAHDAFHRLTVLQRDAAWRESERLKAELEAARVQLRSLRNWTPAALDLPAHEVGQHESPVVLAIAETDDGCFQITPARTVGLTRREWREVRFDHDGMGRKLVVRCWMPMPKYPKGELPKPEQAPRQERER